MIQLLLALLMCFIPAYQTPVVDVWLTGYSAEEGFDEWSRTSNGTVPGWGTCAVDPDVIPYGSILFIQEYADLCGRYAVALDCGGAIEGWDVDLWTETNAQSYSLTGPARATILRLGWDEWTCSPGAWGLK
ncbi:MAG: 3D domain-containing protein [bacterium]